MPYLGVAPNPRQNREVDDISSSFNGSTTAFTLQTGGSNVSPGSDTAIIVSLGGVIQNPGTDYTIAASTITFTTAPASGLSFFGVVLAQSIDIETTADGTVTNAKVNASAAIAGTKISPDFGSQNIVTTGSITGNDLEIDSGTLSVDATNNRVGIGITSPSDKLHVRGASAAFTAFILDNATNSSSPYKITYGDQGQVNHLAVANREMTFGTNNTERMRITEAGQLQIGTTASGGPGGVTIIPNNSQGAASILFDRANTSGTSTVFNFENNNTTVGSISHGNSSTAYNTSSDYRLKENATAISDGITRLKTLKPYRFNFIIDADKTVDGFFAHEVTAVPEAITGTKDEIVTQSHVDSGEYQESELGNPIYQGIDQSKLVPLLTAALQEAITKIETLETKVAALE